MPQARTQQEANPCPQNIKGSETWPLPQDPVPKPDELLGTENPLCGHQISECYWALRSVPEWGGQGALEGRAWDMAEDWE